MDFQIRHQIGQPFGPSPSLSKKSLIHHAFSNDNPRYFGNSRIFCNLQGNVLAVRRYNLRPALFCQADMLLQPCLILRRFLCRFRGLHIQCCKISTKCPGHLCRSCLLYTSCRISIKTRLGTTDTDEWEDLLTVYDKYPLEELIIHPRIQKDFYKFTPRMECYRTAYETSRCSLCYNGDIFSPDDFQNLCREFPDTEKVMLGRGVLQNPWLIGMLRSADPAGGEASAPDKELLHAFCEDLCAGYACVISGDKNVLFKLKALWIYLGMSFTNPQKYLKKIKKANRLAEYEEAVDALFREQELIL